ncbi:MAG: hypothetical protein R3F62_02605 [Planctomycetota bacterium]
MSGSRMPENAYDDFTYEHLRHLLQSALDAGYRFVDYPSMAASRDAEGVCVLRHDCDNDLVAALRMAEIEHALGIQSTYFVLLRAAMHNLLNVTNRTLVQRILALGHRLGLHYDAPSGSTDLPADLRPQIDRERAWLEAEFGQPIEVVSFHQPGPAVLENRVQIGCLNTYDREDMAGFHYLSDSNWRWHEGCPSVLFRERTYPRVQLLLHPEIWTPVAEPVVAKWQRMLRHNYELVQGELLRRERSYDDPYDLHFVPRP